MITGAWVSFTVIVNEHVLTLPAPSVAVYVTVVVPIGNTVPGVWLAVTTKPEPQLSVMVGGVQKTGAPHVLNALFTVMFVGQLVITGAKLSVTVTVKVHVLVLPTASTAVYVTVVVPTGKVAPGA